MLDHAALSALNWWREAGVDLLVDEHPRDWLAPPVAAMAEAAVAPSLHAAKPVLPETLESLQAWLLSDASVPGAPAHRLPAAGDAASGTMIVVDAPEAGDRAAGSLLAGDTGALFDRMLGAIGLARERTYLASMSPARPAGRLDAATLERLGVLLRHHIALVKPGRLLLLGDMPSRALLGEGFATARGRVHETRVADGSVRTVVSLHPRMIADTRDAAQLKDRRAAAWADLQLFASL